jgi:hypothetical protein
MRTKIKTAVRTQKCSCTELGFSATQRLDETDLCSPARDDAERIPATDIMEKISKLHAGTIHPSRMKNRGLYYKNEE